jgi:hypothetical protein
VPDFGNGPKFEILPVGATIVRIHHKDYGAIWFGPEPGEPPRYRFDAPGGEYRVLYLSAALRGAFVETILHKPMGRIIARRYVDERAWTVLSPRRELKLVKVRDDGLHWYGLDANISASTDYRETRRVALAFFQHYRDADGLSYRACHDNGVVCYALFDRVAASGLEATSTTLFAGDKRRTHDLMKRYGAVFDTSGPLPLIAPP